MKGLKNMTILYINATKGDINRQRYTVVRIERVCSSGDGDIKYYHLHEKLSYDEAKLSALSDYLTDGHKIDVEGITIFLDSSELAREWDDILDEQTDVRFLKLWQTIRSCLIKSNFMPHIKSSGFLSGAMRSDLKIYMERKKL